MNSQVYCYLDRFEGDAAVLLIEGREAVVPAAILPADAREGDHLLLSVSVDSAARGRTAEEIARLQKRLQSGGDGA